MPDYTTQDLIQALQRRGFAGADLRTMAAISEAENPGHVLTAVSPSNDYGPVQVNLPTWGQYFTPSELFTLDGSARAAKFIYDQAGGKFTDWTTYTGGAYQAHLPTVDNALLGGYGGTGNGPLNPFGGFNFPSLTIPNVNPLSSITDAISKLIAIIKAPIDITVKLLTWLTTSQHWWEMGFIFVGMAMVGIGIILYFHNEAEGVAKTVAIA